MSAESELAGFIDKFAPEMQGFIRAARDRMRARFPGAWELVWDNYNFLVLAYGPTERPSDAPFSLAAHRRGVNLCLLNGTLLDDPHGLLRGSGTKVRNVALAAAADLDRPEVTDLLDQAVAVSSPPLSEATGPGLRIRSVSAKQRPRR